MAAAHDQFSCKGPSLLTALNRELDDLVTFMQSVDEIDPRMSGHAHGLARAIAIIRNPYFPDVEIDKVKRQSILRWERSQLKNTNAT